MNQSPLCLRTKGGLTGVPRKVRRITVVTSKGVVEDMNEGGTVWWLV